MKDTTKLLVVGIALILMNNIIAQQTRQTNMYLFNKYSLNPAYAGMSGCTEVNFSHLSQWVKVEGAPRTNFLSANTRIGKSLGIGANILIDRLGMLQQVSASGSIAYGFRFAKEHIIRLGISGGYFQMQVDPTGAIAFDVNDNIINGGVQSSTAINTEAGILYKYKAFELSFSTKQMLETRSNFTYPDLDGYGLKRHLMGYASYNFVLNKQLSIAPSVLYKGINNVHQFDINADLNYEDFIYGGLGYRSGVGLVGRIGVNIRKLFFIGYAYELPMQNIASYGAGSHEIAVRLTICKKEKGEPIADVSSQKIDTITIVETRIDTVFVERIDTVVITKEIYAKPSDDKVREAMIQAADHLEFENDKSIILKESYSDLEYLVNILLIREELHISLDGHTDSNGTEDYNLKLSKSRVEAVKAFLVANGVEAERIKTAYFGESKPIADNNTEEGQALNRRVEMKIITE